MSSFNVSSLASNSVLSMTQQNSISRKSSLASSLLPSNEDSVFSGVSLTDYSSLRNGSYGKLLKTYYSKARAEASEAADSAKASDSSSSSSSRLTSYEAKGTLDKLLSTYDASGESKKTEEVAGTGLDTTV